MNVRIEKAGKDGEELVAGVNGNVKIPAGVTTIGSHAFAGLKNLTSVTMPSGVTLTISQGTIVKFCESAGIKVLSGGKVQINGKVRAKIQVGADVGKEEALAAAKENEIAAKWLEGKEIVKEIFVPGKLLNIVVKG